MKTWIAMWGAAVLAAPVLAQMDAAALQRAVLIERQEGDLRLAEAEYRKLVAAGDDDVRAAAAFHLGALLWRLERPDEARPLLEQAKTAGGEVGVRATAVLAGQDPAGKQAQELRARIEDVVDRVLRQEQGAEAELTWLGASAVPELARRLSGVRTEAIAIAQEARQSGLPGAVEASKRMSPETLLRHLTLGAGPPPSVSFAHRAASLLWTLGGPEAAAVLRAQLQDPEPDWRRIVALASERTVHESLLPVVDELLFDAEADAVAQTCAVAAARRLPTERFARLLQSPHAAVREAAWSSLGQNTVRWQTRPELPESVMAMLAPIVESAMAGSNPAEARAAFQFLCHYATKSVRGSEQLLAWLPRVPVFEKPSMPRLRAPLASVVACARQLGKADANDGKDDRRRFLAQVAPSAPRGPEAASLFLDLVELGYDVKASTSLATAALRLEPTPADLERIAGLLGRCHDGSAVAAALADNELPAGAAPALLQRIRALLEQLPVAVGNLHGPQQVLANEAVSLFRAVGRTGSPAAIAELRALRQQRADWGHWVLDATLRIAERSEDAALGVLLRELLVDAQMTPNQRNEIFGALVARADAAAMPLFVKAYELGLEANSVERRPANGPMNIASYRGMGWLRHPGHDRYTDAQRVAMWQSLLASPVWLDALEDATGFSHAAEVRSGMAAALVLRLAEQRAGQQEWEAPNWLRHLCGALARDLPFDDSPAAVAYRRAIGDLCADASVGGTVITSLRDRRAIDLLADRLLPLLRSDHWYAAYETLQVYGEVAAPTADVVACLRLQDTRCASLLELLPRDAAPEIVTQVEAMLTDHGVVERLTACKTLGRFLSASSAPALLQALRDGNEEVRTAATAALNQIRLYHEQKAFWDQFQTGIVTGKEAALAKLLTQAKPGEPKERRVLALWSLGELGSIEALPYLIDWKDDADPELAAAILQAIARIQLNAKK